MDRWALPGPAHFLAEVIEALRDGQNLILACPLNAVARLPESLENRLSDEGWSVKLIRAEPGTDPLEQLFGVLEFDEDEVSRRSVAELCRRLRPGSVVLVNDIQVGDWPRWNRMLTEYEVASRGVTSYDRARLAVVAAGVPLLSYPTKAAALTILPWQDVVGEIDILLYVREKMRSQGALDKAAHLVARIIARLALWDFDLIDYLLQKDRRDLFEPARVMSEVAESMVMGTGFSDNWESGGLMKFDGIELTHPLLICRDKNRTKELTMRLWSAQASEILPLLEIHRRTLCRRMRPYVKLPVVIDSQRFTDLDDLEIGPLAHVAQREKVPDKIVKSIEKWRRLRNKLAHLEALGYSEALDRELLYPN